MPGFVPDISVILAFALAAFVLAISPGPDMALQMSRAINHGFWQAITKGGGLRLAAAGKKQPTYWQSYLNGVGINLLNPKVVLFFVTFLPQFVNAGDPAAPQQLFFLGGEFIAISIPLMVLTVYFAHWIADAFRKTKWVERTINYSFAAIFTAFAATILTAQARH